MLSTEIHRERSRFYRAEEFGRGRDGGREVAGWIGYYVDRKRPYDGHVYTVEEMVPIAIGACCSWSPEMSAAFAA